MPIALALLAALVADAPPVQGWTPSARAVQARLAGGVVQVGCRQGQCIWLRVIRVETVTSGRRGELRRLVARRGVSVHGGADPPAAYSAAVRARWERRDRAEYAFCSTERPAYAFSERGDGYLLHYLDLFSLAGYQYASATTYMRLCHDRPLNPENTAALRRLGYRPGTRSEQVENGAPEDLARF